MRDLGRFERILIVWGSVVGFVVLLLFSFGDVVRIFRIPTPAMEPTIPVGSRVLVRRTQEVGKGDIVAFYHPHNPSVKLLKRIVAVGGDTIVMRDKRLFVNDKEVSEPYVQHEEWIDAYRSRDQVGPYKVPAGEFFILGDNRDHSNDSRYLGAIPKDQVIGEAIVVMSLRDGIRRL